MIENIKQQILDYKKEIIIGSFAALLIIIFVILNNKPTPVRSNVFTDNAKSKKVFKKANVVKSSKYIYVDIQGEVNRPGFYRIKATARVFDLLQLAGGLKDTADRKNVNQAKKITDQEQVYIPKIGEITDPPLIKENMDQDSDEKTEQVNINAATVDELQNLPGVGPKKAEKIVQYREENGGFEKPDDLTKVSGFGEKTLETLKDQITI
ncbi:competence protein ComEA [Companilactobacillus sp. RD055328]|uniref:helix-hairpin-helix domain-containing protein n=1 Tax=Companilactobacillus sp. RD055328 TaxID=2916634 RepID=UPI001FC84B47|nr:helix-hairpin-helix domain-containing protein [Companilactobacillus sp. RD055328]GKQ42814.1 competence protein ComEA [Companilactobacillus sp. RD055328]